MVPASEGRREGGIRINRVSAWVYIEIREVCFIFMVPKHSEDIVGYVGWQLFASRAGRGVAHDANLRARDVMSRQCRFLAQCWRDFCPVCVGV